MYTYVMGLDHIIIFSINTAIIIELDDGKIGTGKPYI